MARTGRPTGYDAERHPVVTRALARAGHTQPEIAKALATTVTTLRRWSAQYPDMCSALKGGCIEADALVEDSLYRRALGYEYEETEIVASRDGKPGRVKRTKRVIHPDPVACIFWLKNRRPDRWRSNPEGRSDSNVGKAAYMELLDQWRRGAEGGATEPRTAPSQPGWP